MNPLLELEFIFWGFRPFYKRQKCIKRPIVSNKVWFSQCKDIKPRLIIEDLG